MNKKMERLFGRIEKKFPDMWVRDAEFFNGSENALWTGESAEIDGLPAFDYYADNSLYIMGVNVKLYNFLDKAGYYASFYDGGTVLIYEK